MKKMRKSIKKSKKPTDAEPPTHRPKTEGSSNEESEEETEFGQQDHQEADTVMAEADEKAGDQEMLSEEDLLMMAELEKLSPAAMAAEIIGLEFELYEVSLREAKEIIRCKHLNIFGNNRRRTNK